MAIQTPNIKQFILTCVDLILFLFWGGKKHTKQGTESSTNHTKCDITV